MTRLPAPRVLVPVDFSPVSARAVAWAARLAAPKARVEALFVYESAPVPVLGLPPAPLSKAGRARIEARLRRLAPRASAWTVVEGEATSVILRRAAAADLVVMGTHGREGLDRALLGSVSEAVVRDCPVPVLVVRGAPRKVASVLAPVNLMPYSRKGLDLAARAAAALGARLTVLHVADERGRGPNPRFYVSGLVARLPAEARRVPHKVVERAGDAVREILAEARRHDLVVLTAHRKALFRDLVLGTTVERVVRHSPAPVLAAPSGR